MLITDQPRNTTYYSLTKETFRSSSRKLFRLYGSNLQNVPDKVRRIYEPPAGYIFVQVDQAGAEAYVVAYLCKDAAFRSLFRCGVKSHVYVALHVFTQQFESRLGYSLADYVKAPVEELTKLPKWREVNSLIKESDKWPAAERYYFIAKMICHASNYGMRGPTFALNVLDKSEGAIRISAKQATEYVERYHKLFPEIRDWHNEIRALVSKTRCLRNLFGYPRLFGGALTDKMFMEANAFIPQSTVGVITHLAYEEFQTFIEENQDVCADWHLLNNCHDSYLAAVPEQDAEICARIMSEFLQRRLVNTRGESFTMRTEASCGFNWGKYQPNNPNGLKEMEGI